MTRSKGRLVDQLASMLVVMLLACMVLPRVAFAADTHEMWSEDKHWCRIWGETALDTMQAVLNVEKDDGAFADKREGFVIIATSDGYWDALAAAGLAGMYDAPVLITPTNKLCEQAKEELKRLMPDHVLVVGGKAAISEAVFGELEGMSNKRSVERIEGKTAADTAVEIFNWCVSPDTTYKPTQTWGDTAIIATSNGYWDALSVAPAAFAKRYPIFLTSYEPAVGGQVLNANAYDTITAGNFKKIIIVGGEAAVSDFVRGQLCSEAYEQDQIVRIAGKTALDTSMKIVEWEIGPDIDMEVTHMMVATSNGYWDAITAAPVAGKLNSVLALVDQYGEHMQAYDITTMQEKTSVDVGYILGGRMALSEAVSNYIESSAAYQ